MIRDILMYLDRTYVEQNNKTTVYEAGLESFRDHVARHEHIKARLLNMMLDYIQSERDGELIDRQLARAIAGMYSDISQQLYQEDFEVPFLETSQQFYEKEAQQFLPACSCADYLKKVEAAGNVLVPCNDDKYSAFAGCVNYRPRSELDELMANMRAAGIASRADAEESAARLAAARQLLPDLLPHNDSPDDSWVVQSDDED